MAGTLNYAKQYYRPWQQSVNADLLPFGTVFLLTWDNRLLKFF